LANYVKFKRGTPQQFSALSTKESDTLYFIYEESSGSAELYLGSRKIAGDGAFASDGSISDLKDIIISEVENNQLLVYDDMK
jgi:hypothetical protein